MDKLPFPVVCDCGFATLDAQEALRHLKEKHPEVMKEWEAALEDDQQATRAETWPGVL